MPVHEEPPVPRNTETAQDPEPIPEGTPSPAPLRFRGRASRLSDRARTQPVVRAAALLAAGGLLALSAPVLRELARWPEVVRLRSGFPASTAFIERWRDGRREAGLSEDPDWRPVPLSRMSPWLAKAVVVSEDIEFFDHRGFSRAETRAAIEQAIERRRPPRGASTITQQLAKNLWLSPARSPVRKLREAVLTIELERALPKARILELYLNVAEFGPGVYGAEAASRHWFGVPADRLGPRQAAMLAASLPRPARWNPESGSAAYRARVERVLDLMGRAEFLNRRLGLAPDAVPPAPPSGEPPVVAPPDPGPDTAAGAAPDMPASDGTAEPEPR